MKSPLSKILSVCASYLISCESHKRLTIFKPGFFYRLKVQGVGGIFRDPLMISGTIKASPMKLCTVIVLLKAYQNTKRNFQKSDLRRHNDVITKTMAKSGLPRNQANYISFERT